MSSSQKDVELWIENYSGSLLRQAYFLLANKEDAEDLVQDVFMTAFLMKDRYQGKSSPLTWLKGILNHKAADLYRRKYKGNETVSMDYFFDENGSWRDQDVRHHWDISTDTSASLLDNENFNKSLQECLQALPQKWGFLIRQCYIQQKKQKKSVRKSVFQRLITGRSCNEAVCSYENASISNGLITRIMLDKIIHTIILPCSQATLLVEKRLHMDIPVWKKYSSAYI